MGELVNSLGHKAAGQLIKSEDWNALVAGVEAGDDTLGRRIDALTRRMNEQFEQTTNSIQALDQKYAAQVQALTGQLQTLTGRVNGLEGQVNDLRAKLTPVLSHLWRVTLETARSSFAIGEVAEITARVTDLQGQPLGSRPWIDFVATWGHLSASPGFEDRSGEGSRTVSVRVNAEGVAKILLHSEYASGIKENTQTEFSTVFKANIVGTNRPVGEVLLNSKTPIEANAAGAFRMFSQEYDRTDTLQMRGFVDAYYVKNASRVASVTVANPDQGLSWADHDYRATVLAFVKGDNDPQTPDVTHAVSSTQVTFRDWIWPWIHLDYLSELEIKPLVAVYRDRLRPRVTGDFVKSIDLLRKEVKKIVGLRGILGKQRDYQAVHTAFDTLTVQQPPAFFNNLTQSMQDAVSIQQTIESAQLSTIGLRDQDVAFNVFTNVAARVDTDVTDVSDKVGRLQQQLDDTVRGVGDIDGKVAGLEGKFTSLDNLTKSHANTLQQHGGFSDRLTGLEGKFTTLDTTTKSHAAALGTLQQGNFPDRVTGLESKFTILDNTTRSHATNLQSLQQNVTRVDTGVRTLNDSFTGFRAKVEPAFAPGGVLADLKVRVDNVTDKVEVLKGFNVIDVQQQLGQLQGIRDDLRVNTQQLGVVRSKLNIP